MGTGLTIGVTSPKLPERGQRERMVWAKTARCSGFLSIAVTNTTKSKKERKGDYFSLQL